MIDQGAGFVDSLPLENRRYAQLARLRDAGVTDLDATIIALDAGAVARTRDFLATELRA